MTAIARKLFYKHEFQLGNIVFLKKVAGLIRNEFRIYIRHFTKKKSFEFIFELTVF